MEPYENEHPFEDQVTQDAPVEQPDAPQPSAPRRKPSPFADSPYMAPSYEYHRTDNGYGGHPQPPAPQPKKKKSRRRGTVGLIICMVVLFLVSSINTYSVKKELQEQNELLIQSYEEKLDALRQEIKAHSYTGSGNSVSGTPNTGVEGGLTPAQVYAQNAKSVVAIFCSNTDKGYGPTTQTTSAGSGFILSEDGYIVSNYHVVEGAASIKITTWDGKSYTAKYIGGEESNDIALLKVEAEELASVKIGSSDALIVGDQVVAIGNPLGELASTLTVGYVSAKDRIVTTDGSQINMLQTDAAINPGNSGGPLFNMKGEVVGITTAKYSGTTTSGASIEGIGFAIPMDDVLGMLDDLKLYGYVTGAYMGVIVSNVSAEDAALYGLPMGVLVHEATVGGAAHDAGIRAQDIIVNLGGHEIENMNDLTRVLRKFKAGETVTVTVFRHSEGQKILSITLDEKPQQTTESTTEPTVNNDMQDWFDRFFGN